MGNQQTSFDDAAQYLAHYPNDSVNDLAADLNYRFYTNQVRSDPDGDFIDNIHKEWYGNHRLLEQHHGYIQWLFPIREDSPFNGRAQRLMRHEIEKMKSDTEVRKRLILSYRLMLEFYGMQLKDENTGAVGRGPNWRERYDFLNSSMHNFLRITRILKCLGELGLDHYQAPFVQNIFTEIIQYSNLTGLFRSAKDYFAAVVRDGEARNHFAKIATEHMNPSARGLASTHRRKRSDDQTAENKVNSTTSDMGVSTMTPESSETPDIGHSTPVSDSSVGDHVSPEASKEDLDHEI